jgi:uncharacterized membrane protein YeaQ/YmgE (transglycosylase-associated protein family)
MGVLSWLLVGLIAGFIGSKIVNRAGEGLVRDVLLGILGAIVGGAIFSRLGFGSVTGVNLPSIGIAIIGAPDSAGPQESEPGRIQAVRVRRRYPAPRRRATRRRLRELFSIPLYWAEYIDCYDLFRETRHTALSRNISLCFGGRATVFDKSERY